MLFGEPLNPVLVNTRLSRRREPWARDLYTGLAAIDQEYADRVDRCVSY